MSDAERPDWPGRFRALRQANKHDRLDALVVSTPANLRFLTGFAGSAGLLVLTDVAGWLVVDGRYTGAVTEGIAAVELPSVGSPGIENLKWLKPVRPGDTISARRTTLDTRASKSKPDIGIVNNLWEVFNQKGELVMSMQGHGMFRRRNSGGAAT